MLGVDFQFENKQGVRIDRHEDDVEAVLDGGKEVVLSAFEGTGEYPGQGEGKGKCREGGGRVGRGEESMHPS